MYFESTTSVAVPFHFCNWLPRKLSLQTVTAFSQFGSPAAPGAISARCTRKPTYSGTSCSPWKLAVSNLLLYSANCLA